MKTHAQLRKEVQKWFEDRGAYVVPQNSQGYGRKGVPDLLVCIKGEFVGLEIKVGRDTPSPWQLREMAAIRAAGGSAREIRSVEQVEQDYAHCF